MDKRLARILSVSFILGLSSAAFAGTHSPELEKLSSNKSVDVIITYGEHRNGATIAVGQKLLSLPGGELRRMSVADAIRVSGQSDVAHASVNHQIYGTAVTTPGYDYMPQGIQPTTKPLFGLQVLNQGQGGGNRHRDQRIESRSAQLRRDGRG